MKNYLTVIITVLLFPATNSLFAREKSKFNAFLTYKHSFGLMEKNTFWSKKQDLYGNSFFVKGTYSLGKIFAIGAGFGADALEKSPRYTAFPVYASLHIAPLKNKNMFIYNDIGYSMNTKKSFPGLHYESGIAYKRMLKKYFGLLLNLGYNLKEMENILIIHEDGSRDKSFTGRRSLSAGLGVVF